MRMKESCPIAWNAFSVLTSQHFLELTRGGNGSRLGPGISSPRVVSLPAIPNFLLVLLDFGLIRCNLLSVFLCSNLFFYLFS